MTALARHIEERREMATHLRRRLEADLHDLGYVCWPTMSSEVIEMLMHKGWRLRDIGLAGFDLAGMPFNRKD